MAVATNRLEQLQALLSKEPNDAFLNFGVAMELAKAQRFDESLARFDQVITLDPNYVAAHFHKGKTLLGMGEVEAAKNALRAGIQQASQCGEMHAKGEMEELLNSL
jgi:predicted Zn-dependent protease